MSVEEQLRKLELDFKTKIDQLSEISSTKFADLDKRVLIVLHTNKQTITKFNEIDKKINNLNESTQKMSDLQNVMQTRIDNLENETITNQFQGGLAISTHITQSQITNDIGDLIQDCSRNSFDIKNEMSDKKSPGKIIENYENEKAQFLANEKIKIDNLDNLVMQEILPKLNEFEGLSKQLDETRKIINEVQNSCKETAMGLEEDKATLIKFQQKFKEIQTVENLVMKEIHPKMSKFDEIFEQLEEVKTKLIKQHQKFKESQTVKNLVMENTHLKMGKFDEIFKKLEEIRIIMNENESTNLKKSNFLGKSNTSLGSLQNQDDNDKEALDDVLKKIKDFGSKDIAKESTRMDMKIKNLESLYKNEVLQNTQKLTRLKDKVEKTIEPKIEDIKSQLLKNFKED